MQTPKKPNFTGLDRKQQGILSAGGWHPGLGVSTPSARTLQKLLDRGFLELGGLGYSVPADISLAWIKHGARLVHPSEQAVTPETNYTTHESGDRLNAT